MSRFALVLAASLVVVASTPAPAQQPNACRRVVIYTLADSSWSHVRRFSPHNLLRAARDGAMGSMSVRTDGPITGPAAAFATISAGTRMNGGALSGGSERDVAASRERAGGGSLLETRVRPSDVSELRRLARESAYQPVPGALGAALQDAQLPLIAVGNGDLGLPPARVGFGRWSLLAAMNRAGVVPLAATDPDLLDRAVSAPFGARTDPRAIERAAGDVLRRPCSSMVVDHGDLTRVAALEASTGRPLPRARRDALLAADRLLGQIRASLDERRDLLLIVASTSPASGADERFGVAVAVGGGFEPGSTLSSPSTQRPGIVTLPDLAPTALSHLGLERPPSMLGRPWFGEGPSPADPIAAAAELNDESVFIDAMRTPISTAFVIFQVVVYLAIIWLLRARQPSLPASGKLGRGLEVAALGVVGFPAATYVMGMAEQHALGPLGFAAALLVADAILVVVATLLFVRPLDRLLSLTAFTLALLLIDGVTGTPLQLNTVFSYSPLVAGRFAGFGNIAYSVIAATCLITGALLVHRFGRATRTLLAVAALFAVTIVVDGAPQFGSDVGGIISLVPGLGVAWILLSGRRVTPRVILLSALVLLLAVAAFLALDLARPPQSRTHFARLVEDVRAGGLGVLSDTIVRKLTTNLRVFGSTIWTYLVPPALALIAWLFLRPRGRWARFAITHPPLRAGLVSGVVVAILGFSVNDSGIVIPALMLSYLVPLALLIHLSMERGVLKAGEQARGETFARPAEVT